MCLVIALAVAGIFAYLYFSDQTFTAFEQKQECQKYAEAITDRLAGESSDSADSVLSGLFYSPKAESCLFIVERSYYANGQIIGTLWSLNDALTYEIFLTANAKWDDPSYYDQKDKFDKYVAEYK